MKAHFPLGGKCAFSCLFKPVKIAGQAAVGIRYNKLRKKENTKKKTYLRINLDGTPHHSHIHTAREKIFI